MKTDKPVCPYCGKEFTSIYDEDEAYFTGNYGIIKCSNCDKDCIAERHVSITFSTEKMDG